MKNKTTKITTVAGLGKLQAFPTNGWYIREDEMEGEYGEIRRNDKLAEGQCPVSSLARRNSGDYSEVAEELGIDKKFSNRVALAADYTNKCFSNPELVEKRARQGMTPVMHRLLRLKLLNLCGLSKDYL